MPDLTLTVTDDQKTRIDAAFGNSYPEETLDSAFYAAWIKEKIRNHIVHYESGKRNPGAAIESDLDGEGWNS